MVTLSGTSVRPVAETVDVEVYRAAVDPSGYGEGKSFVGSVATDGYGAWTLTFPGAGGCFTAFMTEHSLLVHASASSEFSANTCRTFLPFISR
jgi:hypothetical protein